MPHLVQMAATYESSGLQVLAITDAPVEEVALYADEQQLTFPVLAGAAETREAYGIEMIWGSPVYLVDPSGVVVAEELESVERFLEQPGWSD